MIWGEEPDTISGQQCRIKGRIDYKKSKNVQEEETFGQCYPRQGEVLVERKPEARKSLQELLGY